MRHEPWRTFIVKHLQDVSGSPWFLLKIAREEYLPIIGSS